MPRVNGVYFKPDGTEAVTGEVIEATNIEARYESIESDLNFARPIIAGGTGANNASAARNNLGIGGLVNLTATAPPSATNDQTEDYGVGSFWYDVTADIGYVCLDADENAAVWTPMSARLPNGSASAPSVTWASDTNSGFYRASSDVIGVSVGGSQIAEFHPDRGIGAIAAQSPGFHIHELDAGTNRGRWLLRAELGVLRLESRLDDFTFGQEIMRAVRSEGVITEVSFRTNNINRLRVFDSNTEVTNQLGVSNGSAAAPAVAASADTNTGLFFPVADRVALSAGGSARLTASTDNLDGAVPFVTGSGSGLFHRDNTSTGVFFASNVQVNLQNSFGFALIVDQLGLRFDGNLRPNADNAFDIGTSSTRVREIFAEQALNTPSDLAGKELIEEIPPAMLRAVRATPRRAFRKLNETGGQIHFGVVADDFKAALEAEGLDPFANGILMQDENRRLSMRYQEFDSLDAAARDQEIAALRRAVMTFIGEDGDEPAG